ncbi:hypothetical protein C5167_043227 [Papaver somniferum]|uniref:chitinase n=1 Tax=Papaver somniferum TaxID=3469 RepID=A0A4Y7L8U9_PAPSO|nr:hypothetical protein C5167_043227 [Papaver somniferum]
MVVLSVIKLVVMVGILMGITSELVGAQSVDSMVTPEFFDRIISQAGTGCAGKKFYTRDAFLEAAKSYPDFGHAGTVTKSKREIAAFFAHVTHGTGRKLSNLLLFASVRSSQKIARGTHCLNSTSYPCAPGKKYYGRGPIQLTWNYNYGAAGESIGFDGLNNPEIVASDVTISFKTALWFWMNYVHSPITSDLGFGRTIRRINGGECHGRNEAVVRLRVG